MTIVRLTDSSILWPLCIWKCIAGFGTQPLESISKARRYLLINKVLSVRTDGHRGRLFMASSGALISVMKCITVYRDLETRVRL